MEGPEGGGGGGSPNPISQQIVFFKSQLNMLKSHNPSLCCSNWNPIPIFLLFLFHESQSQCTKSHFPASKRGKSQLPFYPFMTLVKESIFSREMWSWLRPLYHPPGTVFSLFESAFPLPIFNVQQIKRLSIIKLPKVKKLHMKLYNLLYFYIK